MYKWLNGLDLLTADTHKGACSRYMLRSKSLLLVLITPVNKPIKVCHYMSWPLGYKCNHIRHEVEHCMRYVHCTLYNHMHFWQSEFVLGSQRTLLTIVFRDDYTLRMKEYERERRLRKRWKHHKFWHNVLKFAFQGSEDCSQCWSRGGRIRICWNLQLSLVKCKNLYRVV